MSEHPTEQLTPTVPPVWLQEEEEVEGGRRGAYLGVEVATHSLLGPGLEVELCPALLLRVGHHVSHGLDRQDLDEGF